MSVRLLNNLSSSEQETENKMGGLIYPYSVIENKIADKLHEYLVTEYTFTQCLHIAHWLCEGKLPYDKLKEINNDK